jgi:monoterpene epsilon-lactone hydrolase
MLRRPRGLRAQSFGAVPGEWLTPVETPAATLLYLHGGAFFCGSPQKYRSIAAFFAGAGFAVFTPAYRLAPEHPFPAALEDVKVAYAALAAERALQPIVVAGDSAGGGLALSLMGALRDEGLALPRAAALFSPWTDLAVTGQSARLNESKDAVFSRRMLKIAARNYLRDASAKNPLASPLYADLRGLPPLLLQTGADEMLRDDAVRLADRAREAGVEAQLRIWPTVPHGWQLSDGLMPEARESLALAAEFLRRCSHDPPIPRDPAVEAGRAGCVRREAERTVLGKSPPVPEPPAHCLQSVAGLAR